MDGPVTVTQDHPERGLREELIQLAVTRVLSGEEAVIGELSIVLTDHATVRDLNREWLGHDFETDVVSFSLGESSGSLKQVEGEIYVDLDTAAERAPEFGASFEEEVLRYVIHGLLHLLGYDDVTDEQRLAMRTLEDHYVKQP